MSRHPVTYCTNIHPGESWAETRANVERHTLAVKARLSPDAPFPVGLRVSNLASRQVDEAESLAFRRWLDENGLYVATVNGFPYGEFHGRPVKQDVYLPDWRDPERAAYTLRLAGLLAAWLPDGMEGSISTVPLGFRRGFPEEHLGPALENMREALRGLAELAGRTGRFIRLSVEPEPACLVETTPELVTLHERLDLPDALAPHFAACYDCCHQALQYEDPAWSLGLLERSGIAIGHVQVSSALHLPCGELGKLSRFDEPVYLHQSVARTDGGELTRFDDLGEAIRAARAACAGSGESGEAKAPEDARGVAGRARSWRVHFHLPVFLRTLPECETTQDFLSAFLPLLPGHTPLEVETYTFGVLPEELRSGSVVDCIVREIEWVEACRAGGGG